MNSDHNLQTSAKKLMSSTNQISIIQTAMNATQCQETNTTIASCFYKNAWPFHNVNSNEFKTMITGIQKLKKKTYRISNRKELAGDLLDKEYSSCIIIFLKDNS